MTALVRRDQSDEILPELTPQMIATISSLKLKLILDCVTALAKGPPQAHPPRPALVMAASVKFGAAMLERLLARGTELAHSGQCGESERKEWWVVWCVWCSVHTYVCSV